MDSLRRRRMRRLTRAVYDGAAERRGDTDERPRVRVLPGPGAVAVLVLVMLLITGASVWRILSGGARAEGDGGMASGGWSEERGPGAMVGSDPSGSAAPTSDEPHDVDTAGDEGGRGSRGSGNGTATVVVVYVTGQVRAPGVVELPEGSRVGDAVEAAGGAGPEADLGAVNMARVLVDGEHIVLPAPGEVVPPASAGVAGSGAGGGGAGGSGTSGGGSGGNPAAGATCVDLNTADEQGLQALDGVGPALAGRIVAHRDQVGSFTSVEQLDDVPGIGPALVQRIARGACP